MASIHPTNPSQRFTIEHDTEIFRGNPVTKELVICHNIRNRWRPLVHIHRKFLRWNFCTPKIIHDFFGMAKQKIGENKDDAMRDKPNGWSNYIDRNPESVDNESGLKMDGVSGVMTLWCPSWCNHKHGSCSQWKVFPLIERQVDHGNPHFSFKMNSPNLKCANPAPEKGT